MQNSLKGKDKSFLIFCLFSTVKIKSIIDSSKSSFFISFFSHFKTLSKISFNIFTNLFFKIISLFIFSFNLNFIKRIDFSKIWNMFPIWQKQCKMHFIAINFSLIFSSKFLFIELILIILFILLFLLIFCSILINFSKASSAEGLSSI